jgi:diguanylate cyclase (GGDEF)-like protein
MHLTNLRDIYTAYGSDNADTLLCQIIQNIREHCRDQDNIFRFSEDKFVVLLSNTSPEEAERISHRLADICNTEERQINGTKINCKIDIELVECGSEESCSACDHIDQQHCISQPNKR